MNFSSFNPTRIPTKDEIDQFRMKIGMSSKTQIPLQNIQQEDSKPKMVRYQCPNSGDGSERLIEEGIMSHRCPECMYNGKKFTFIHLNGMSYCS